MFLGKWVGDVIVKDYSNGTETVERLDVNKITDSHDCETTSEVEGQPRHPGLLHANREAKHEGLKYYTSCKGKGPFVGTKYPSRERPHVIRLKDTLVPIRNHVYINFDVDVFTQSFSHSGIDDLNFEESVIHKTKHLGCAVRSGADELAFPRYAPLFRI